MKKAHYIVLFILIFNIFNCLAQDEKDIYTPQIMPPSPDAAALGKYGQYPVSMSSGLVQIDIPLYSIDLPKISVPISISYHASGIKVDEISSIAGLGWALNAGGVITRSTRGKPDAKFGTTGVIKDEDFINSIGPTGTLEETKIGFLDYFYRGERDGFYDPESDVYYYNACGLSGSFRFDINGTLVQTPLSNNKIEYNINRDIFNIIATDGTIYYFEDKEYSYPSEGGVRHVSSWFLSKIKSSDGKIVLFEYTTDNTSYSEFYESYQLRDTYIPSDPLPFGNAINYNKTNIITDNTLILKSIKFASGTVKFNHLTDRKDRRKFRLSEIGIYNNKNEFIKGFSFEHGYFTPTSVLTSEQVEGSQIDEDSRHNYRLKLDKLHILNKDKGRETEYSFEYNTSILLPPYYNISPTIDKKYFGQDLWGFYNGIETNNNLVAYDTLKFYMKNFPPANRSINTHFASACILKKINYPTGGSTVFEYEGNKGTFNKNTGGLRIKNILSYSSSKSGPMVRSYRYEDAVDNSAGNQGELMGTIYTQGLISKPPNQSDDIVTPVKHYLIQPNMPLSYNGGASAFYKKVIEYDGYPEDCNGKTEHYFLYLYNDVNYYPLLHCNIPFLDLRGGGQKFATKFNYAYEDRSWTRGQPQKTEIYKKKDGVLSLIKRTEYTYKIFNEKNHKVGFRAFANFNTATRIIPNPYGGPLNANELYQYTDFITKTGLVKLIQVRDTSYFDNKKVTQSTIYSYDRLNNQYEISSEQQINSDGTIHKKNYKYPNDLKSTDNVYNIMSELNIISPVVIKIDSINNKFSQYIQTYYKLHMPTGGEWYTDYIVQPDYITKKIGSAEAQREITYHQYDDQGNLLAFSKKDDVYETIIWGYNNTLPVATLSNISYPSVSSNSNLTGYLNQLQNYTTLTDPAVRNNLEALNQAIRKELPNDIQIITCTYQPLVGITSMTDPKGITTYYEYDNIGRLKRSFIIEKNTLGQDIESNLQEYDFHFGSK